MTRASSKAFMNTKTRVAIVTSFLAIVMLIVISIDFVQKQSKCEEITPYVEHYYDLFLGCRVKLEGEWFTRKLD